jgi:hypothetical protein
MIEPMSRILRMPLFRLPRCAKSLRLRLALTGGVEAIGMHNIFQKVDKFIPSESIMNLDGHLHPTIAIVHYCSYRRDRLLYGR